MKKRIVVEIDVPETFSQDPTGFSDFRETFIQYALSECIERLLMAKNSEVEIGKKEYIEHIETKNEIVNTAEMVAYIKGNQYFEFDRISHTFKQPQIIHE